jgi:fused signal recognition particle receptor
VIDLLFIQQKIELSKDMFSFFKSSFSKIKNALSKTRSLFVDQLRSIFKKPLSPETLEELEKTLYEADIGAKCAQSFTDKIKKFSLSNKNATSLDYLDELKNYAAEILDENCTSPSYTSSDDVEVILVVGVNGSGKTTSCAKMANHFKKEGKKVLLAAADTFRAAAIDQLEIWAKKLDIPIVKGQPGSDPSAVIFDALTSAKAKGYDLVIADTAGRLQSKTDLMHELAKVKKVCAKVIPKAPHHTFLVIDATTGQNGIDQARTFNSFTPLSGLILTKLDGSAKGGIVLSICSELKLPIAFVGVGEGAEDLEPFDKKSYLEALFS